MLVDHEWFMVYDTLQKMETIRNPRGLYWNYFYHVWQILSVSRFANAVAFVSGAVKAVTQVIVDPTIASLKQGKSMQFTAYVRATDGLEHDVVWSITPSGSTTVKAGTTIDQEGVLTVAVDQLGELLVKATVDIGFKEDGTTPDLVVGESIVTVVPTLI